MSLIELDLIDWGPKVFVPDPNVCDECGGLGEIVYGDGGGDGGRATETGYTEPCSVCEGTGDGGLVLVARMALKEKN